MALSREVIYDILQADSNITDEISTRAFMTYAPSETTKPFLIYRTTVVDDTFTKDKTSTVHKHLVEIDIYHNTVKEAEALGRLIYNQFQGFSGTTSGGAVVTGCKFDREEQDTDEDGWDMWTQDYEIIIVT